jgi:hypothetical protein
MGIAFDLSTSACSAILTTWAKFELGLDLTSFAKAIVLAISASSSCFQSITPPSQKAVENMPNGPPGSKFFGNEKTATAPVFPD